MIYSYTKAKKKTILTPELQLLLLFFFITIFMLLSTYLFLLFKDYSFTQDREAAITKKEHLNSDINTMKESIRFIDAQKVLSEQIYTQNSVLKESITNLFDLIPSRITLSEASLLEDGLILYGITPNKDVYNFMLQAPLRSIFHKTYSSFYPTENGWLRFVSTNYTQSEDLTVPPDEIEDEEEIEDED